MCEPTTILTIGTAAMSMMAQLEAAADQADAIRDSARAQADETGDQLQQEAGERVAQGRRERATMLVSAGEAGIGINSNSFEAQLQNSFGAQNKDLAVIQKNATSASRGIEANANSAYATTPSGLQIAGEFASTAINAYGSRPKKITKP